MENDWIKKAIKKKGALRKALKVPSNKKISVKKLKEAASGKLGPKTEKRAKLALTLRKIRTK